MEEIVEKAGIKITFDIYVRCYAKLSVCYTS